MRTVRFGLSSSRTPSSPASCHTVLAPARLPRLGGRCRACLVQDPELGVGPAEAARLDVRVGERHPRVVLCDPVRSALDHRAIPGVDDRRFGALGCALLLDDELRPHADLRDGAEVRAALGEPRFPWRWGFGLGDGGLDGVTLKPEVDGHGLVLGELLLQVRQDRAQAWRVRRQLVHAFDSMMVGVTSNPERYHLTLTAAGRPTMQGWWGSEVVARRKFTGWVGDWGVPGARVTLVNEQTGETLTTWPEET